MNDYEIWMIAIDSYAFLTVGGACPNDPEVKILSIEEMRTGDGCSLNPPRFNVYCEGGRLVQIISLPIAVYYRRKA